MDTDVAPRTDLWSARGLPTALLVVAATMAVIAVPYWTSSFDSIRDDGILGAWRMVALALFAGTFLAGAVSAAPLWTVMPGMLVCAPIAVVGRVVMDTAADPTSHNLWPFEVVLAGIMSVPAICLGAAVAWGVRRLSPSSR